MPVVFKQTYNSFNLEFDDYLEVLFNANDSGFLSEVQAAGRQLIAYVLQIRLAQTELREFNDEILVGQVPGEILIIGRLVILTAKMLKQAIDEKLTSDFPKFIGTKTNFWRYLLRFIPVFMSEVGPDYTKELSVATACLLELNFFCFRVGQLHLVENSRMFWTALFLHFFGERFRGRDKRAFLDDLNLKTEEIEEKKKSRKQNKKCHK